MRRSGEDERWRDGWPIDNYGKIDQNEWLDTTVPDPRPTSREQGGRIHYDIEPFFRLNYITT